MDLNELLQLTEGPNRSEIPLKIEIQRPRLMYLQYHLVDIHIAVGSSFKTQGGHLYFAVRLKDEGGKWINGHDRADMELKGNLDPSQEIRAAMALYVRPGKYEIVVTAYESSTRAATVVHQPIDIEGIEKDALPDLDKHLSAAAFPENYPSMPNAHLLNGELFEVKPFVSPLVLNVPEQTRIDIVAAVSRSEDVPPPMTIFRRGLSGRLNPEPNNPETQYRFQLGRVLQSAYVLSQLRPSNGCVTLTIIDPMKRKVIMRTAAAASLDWESIPKSIDSSDQMTVDARQLADKKGAAIFSQKFFEELALSPSTCGEATPAKRRYVALISHTLPFPKYSGERISPAAAESATYYHFFNDTVSYSGDQLRKVLKPADVREMSFSSPSKFRKAIARYVQELQRGK